MVDSIGRAPLGRSQMVGQKRKNVLQKTIRKMEAWRDAARINLFQQRLRYKRKVAKNKALMEIKKSGRLPNLNPSSYPSNWELGLKPKSIHRYQVTHSTVSLKPRYSIVKPRERIYGNKWKKIDQKAAHRLELVSKTPTKLKAKPTKLIKSRERIYRKSGEVLERVV